MLSIALFKLWNSMIIYYYDAVCMHIVCNSCPDFPGGARTGGEY